jgi:hypothetical protein
MVWHRSRLVLLLAATGFMSACSVFDRGNPTAAFVVVSDMRHYLGTTEFRSTARAIAAAGPGGFIVSPGDLDPPADVYAMIRDEIGSDVPWYPGVGNHEAETPSDMAWLRTYNAGGDSLPGIVDPGPPGSVETCYSFDRENVHIVMINPYFDGASDVGTDGDVVPALLAWLDTDLASTMQPVVIVFGHEPAFPQPDTEEPHTLNHEGDSLDKYPARRDAFWQLLVDHGVDAYVCGHTHGYSRICVDGVWQIDGAHGAGTASPGARSTFLRFMVTGSGEVGYEVWRNVSGCLGYEIADIVWL